MNIKSLRLNTKFVGFDSKIYEIVGKNIETNKVSVQDMMGNQHEISYSKLLDILGY